MNVRNCEIVHTSCLLSGFDILFKIPRQKNTRILRGHFASEMMGTVDGARSHSAETAGGQWLEDLQ